jgi:hypothetical protein
MEQLRCAYTCEHDAMNALSCTMHALRAPCSDTCLICVHIVVDNSAQELEGMDVLHVEQCTSKLLWSV